MTGTRAVIAALLILGLAGCTGDDPKPKVAPSTPTAPSTASTTEAPGPTPPTMPEAAKGTDAASAEAFAEYYQATIDYAQATGDVRPLRDLGLKCRGCDAGIEFITDVYEAGGTIEGGNGRLGQFDVGFIGARNGTAIVECVVETTEQKVDLPGEKNDVVYPAGSQPIRFILDSTNEAWVVRSLGRQ